MNSYYKRRCVCVRMCMCHILLVYTPLYIAVHAVIHTCIQALLSAIKTYCFYVSKCHCYPRGLNTTTTRTHTRTHTCTHSRIYISQVYPVAGDPLTYTHDVRYLA